MAVYPERRTGRLTGKWIAEVTLQGERRRKRFDTKRDGERWADFIKLTGAAPVDETVDKPKGPTVDAVAKEARINHPGWESGRDPSLEQRLAYVVDTLGPDTPITDVQEPALDKLVRSLKHRPGKTGRISPQTINRYLAAASALLSYAKTRKYIVGLPTIPWLKWEKKRMHWLTKEQEDAVANEMIKEGNPTHAVVMRVLSSTGMRWSEFEGLTSNMIEGEWIKLDRTKTNTPRDIPINAEQAEELRGIIVRGEVPEYQTFRNSLKRALKSAGQNTALSVHGLRHSTATRLVHRGVNLAVVQQFLGHKTINTTLKYTHVTPDLLQEAAKILTPHAGQSAKVLKFEIPKTPGNKGEVEATVGIEPTCTDLQSDV